jgi:hypothetical protein
MMVTDGFQPDEVRPQTCTAKNRKTNITDQHIEKQTKS